MRKQSALAAALRARGPQSEEERREREARLRKMVADLEAEAARQVTEELERISAQLSAGSVRALASLTERRGSDEREQLRIAKALLQSEGLPTEPRIVMLEAQLTDSEEERADALRRLAGRYNKGRQKDDARWDRAKRAWLEAHRRNRPHRAIEAAMEASGFGKSAVYERAKRENWRSEVDR